MIREVFIKKAINFEEVRLDFNSNFIVFTGASGAGKSVLFNTILSIFALANSEVKLAEAFVEGDFDFSKFGILKDDSYIFKSVKEKNKRFFINNQMVSKRALKEIALSFINYLSIGEVKELEDEFILELFDLTIKDREFKEVKSEFKKSIMRF